MANYEVESADLAVNIAGAENITANISDAQPLAVTIGTAAEMEASQAVVFVESGKAEVQKAVAEQVAIATEKAQAAADSASEAANSESIATVAAQNAADSATEAQAAADRAEAAADLVKTDNDTGLEHHYDVIDYYGWKEIATDNIYYTENYPPEVGDTLYRDVGGTITQYTTVNSYSSDLDRILWFDPGGGLPVPKYADRDDNEDLSHDEAEASDAYVPTQKAVKTYVDNEIEDCATAAQGAKADTALQPNDNISELTNNAGYITDSALSGYATESWVESQGYITDGDIPSKTSDLENDSGFITSAALSGYATESWVGNQGYITGITLSDVITALGYTPYNSSNPAGYTSNVGTVTSVNNVSPVNGNVTLTIPAAQVNSDWNAASGVAQILNKPTIGNATLTITQGGTTKGTFTANASSDVMIALDAGGGGGATYTAGDGIDITNDVISVDTTVIAQQADIPTNNNQLTNGAGYITSSALTPYVLSSSLATVATSGSYNDLSNKPDLSGYAADNAVVHLSGAETVTGDKTFSGNCAFNNTVVVRPTDSAGMTVQNTTISKGTAPTDGNVAARFLFNDKNGNTNTYRLGEVSLYYNTDGVTSASMIAFRPVSGVNTAARIAVYYPPTGNPYTFAPAPTDTYSATSGTQIATTGWVASNFVNLVGAQTITGSKTFSSPITVNTDSGTMSSLKCSDIDCTSYVSSTKNKYFGYFDKNNVYLAGLQLHYTTSESTVRLQLRKQTDTTTSAASLSYLGLKFATTGNAYGLAPDWLPISDNTYTLGNASYRWKQLFAGTTTISTSDERLKQGIESVPDAVLDAWGEVEFYRYKFNDSVAEKGFAAARYHTGMVAQRIANVFTAHGLNAADYGLLCFDEWEAEPAELDEDGQIVTPAKAAGNRYSLRYEECLCMEAAYQRRRADRMETRLAALEKAIFDSKPAAG